MEFWHTYKKGILPLAILIVAVGIFAVFKATRPEIPLKEVVERSWPVAVQQVTFQNVLPNKRVYGEIRAGREAELRPQVSGTVISVMDALGDGAEVRAGDLLVQIDDFNYVATRNERFAELAEKKAKLSELEATLAGEEKLLPGDENQVGIASREVERQRKLLKRSAVSRKSYDDALSGLNDRKQNVLVRQQSIARLKTQVIQAQSAVQKAETALQKAERDVVDTQLKAPFDGFLSDMDVTAGKQVSTSDRLGRLISLSRLEVAFHLSEADYVRLSEKGPIRNKIVKVSVPDVNHNDTYRAEIIRLDARVDAATGGRKVFAALSGLGLETALRPGLFVEVEVPDRMYENVVSLPAQALHDGNAVYVVAEGRLRKRQVHFVARDGGRVLIGDGLQEGETVCITRFAEMGSGIKVTVK